MSLEHIKNKLQSEEYSFLKDNELLKDNIMLLTLGGSYAYGTNVQKENHQSDIDLRGIRLNSINEILSMKCDDKPFEHRDLDVVIYPLKQMINLLSKCNPNTIEILGTKEEHIFTLSKEGKLLKDNAELFLSQNAYYAFGGYATAQLRRLENALARGVLSQEQKEEHILKTLKHKIISFEEQYKPLSNDMLNIYTDTSTKDEYNKEIYMDINLSKYPLRDFNGAYSQLRQIVSDFDKLNHRNSKKDEEHLLKHAMHLIRLLKMGTEILEGKGINTYRAADRTLLLDIRNGKYTYQEIFELAHTLEEDFEYAYKNTILPKQIDLKKIDELTMEINMSLINRQVKKAGI